MPVVLAIPKVASPLKSDVPVKKALPEVIVPAENAVVEAFVAKKLGVNIPVEALTCVVEAFARVVFPTTSTVPVNKAFELVKPEEIDIFVVEEFPDTNSLVTENPVADKLVVLALLINAFVEKNPEEERLVVDAFVENSDARNAPVALTLVVDAFPI